MRVSHSLDAMGERFGYFKRNQTAHDRLGIDFFTAVDFMEETKKIETLTLQLSNVYEMITRQKIILGRLEKELDAESKIATAPQPAILTDICAMLADIDAENEAQLTLVENNRSRINSFSQLVNNPNF